MKLVLLYYTTNFIIVKLFYEKALKYPAKSVKVAHLKKGPVILKSSIRKIVMIST
jgi:hypothetical protein